MNKLISILILIITLPIVGQVPNYVPSSGLIGWLPFSGSTNDQSANNYNLNNNNVTFGNDRNGSPSSAAYFSGNSSYLTSQSEFNEFGSNPEQSYSLWFKNVQSNWRYILNYANSSSSRFSLVPNTINPKVVGIHGSSGCVNCNGSSTLGEFSTPGIDNGWHHIGVSISSGTYSLYYDGSLVSTNPHNGFNCVDPNFRLILGNLI